MDVKLDKIREVTLELIQSYLQRLSSTSQILSRTYEAVEECRKAREKARHDLQELLAKQTSLRRRDFNNSYQHWLEPHELREKNLVESLLLFLSSQQKWIEMLRGALENDNFTSITKLKETIQEETEQMCQQVTAYENEQAILIYGLRSLLESEKNLTPGHFKQVLVDLKNLSRKDQVLLREVLSESE